VTDKTPNSIDKILGDLIRLNAIKCTPSVLKLLGGEPLLHPDITESIELFRGVLPNSEIMIWTNGILLPKMKNQFFENCKTYDIKITVTGYPIEGLSNNERKAIVNKHEFIKFDNYFDNHGDFWDSPISSEHALDHPQNNYNKCRIKWGRCNILRDGKIYQCPLPAYIDYLNKHFNRNFVVNESDYVDIYKIQNEQDMINRIYQPTSFCKYCSAECGRNVKWEQSNKNIIEWVKQ